VRVFPIAWCADKTERQAAVASPLRL